MAAARTPPFPAATSHLRLISEPLESLPELDVARLAWPIEGAARAGEGTNRLFTDYSHMNWTAVDEAISAEYAAMTSSLVPGEPMERFWARLARVKDDDQYLETFGLIDPGVLSATFALNAARCSSSTSCSGHGRYPAYIIFWLRPHRAQLILDAAHTAGVHVVNGDDGDAVAFSDEVFGMFRFGVEVRRSSSAFRRTKGPRRPSMHLYRPLAKVHQQQMTLNLF